MRLLLLPILALALGCASTPAECESDAAALKAAALIACGLQYDTDAEAKNRQHCMNVAEVAYTTGVSRCARLEEAGSPPS